jgi:Na+/melibiose symporter-like transporter
MIFIYIISFGLLFSSSFILSDDYLENISVNTGETATFICDLPEKYSNKQVRSHVIYHLFLLSFFQ